MGQPTHWHKTLSGIYCKTIQKPSAACASTCRHIRLLEDVGASSGFRSRYRIGPQALTESDGEVPIAAWLENGASEGSDSITAPSITIGTISYHWAKKNTHSFLERQTGSQHLQPPCERWGLPYVPKMEGSFSSVHLYREWEFHRLECLFHYVHWKRKCIFVSFLFIYFYYLTNNLNSYINLMFSK